MTGEVLEMNKAIDTDKGRPQLINRDPLGKGWILKMKATGKILIVRVSTRQSKNSFSVWEPLWSNFKSFEKIRGIQPTYNF